MYRPDFWTLWEKARVGCFKRTASKHVYVWNIYAYVCIHTCICMKQIASPGGMHETSARMWYTGKTQRDRVEKEVEGGSGWGTHVNPWLIHFNVWQKPLQCCKVISLQLIKINEKKKEKLKVVSDSLGPQGLYSPWNSPGQNTEVGSHSLFRGTFPTQGSIPGLPHCRWILYQLSHQGSPRVLNLGSLSLLQWIFPTQELNQGLLHCRWILYQPHWKAILNYSLSQYCLICSLPWISEVGRNF